MHLTHFKAVSVTIENLDLVMSFSHVVLSSLLHVKSCYIIVIKLKGLINSKLGKYF